MEIFLAPLAQLVIILFQTASVGYKCPSTDSSPTLCSGSSSEQFSYLGSTTCSKCPAGYECPNVKSIPTPCSPGFYSEEGDAECSLCPAGSSCSNPADAPVSCDDGYYALPGSTYCAICPLGYYCPSTEEPPIQCPAGSYSAQGSQDCIACSLGKFCPSTKIPGPYDCPSGFYASQKNSTSCKMCPAGFYCSDPTLDPKTCDEGTYSFGAASSCLTCPAGYYCPQTNKEPVICPKGKHSLAGQSECLDCVDGYNCFQTNLNNEQPCSTGQYRVNDGRTTVCRDCPPGYYCSDTDQTPMLCDEGTYSTANSTSCTACSAGYFCPTLADLPQACPPGTYQPLGSKTYCNECPPGFYCSSTTISTPSACPAGSYAPVGNSTACLKCPKGFYCPSASTQLPIVCPKGYYSNAEATSCTKCEAGYACPTPFSTDKYQCPTGQYSEQGSLSCFICPAGSSCTINNGDLTITKCDIGFISDAGASSCQACPAGKSCHTLDSRGMVDCDEGFYSLAGEVTCKPCPGGFMCPNKDGTGIVQCAAGQFAPKGSIKCFDCPKGFYCPYPHLANIQRCPAGTYSLGNQQVCTECPEHFECPHRDSIQALKNGYYSPKGTGIALKCRAGFYCLQENVAEPQVRPCDSGYFSETGASSCTICPVGSYCPLPDNEPMKCPRGMYQDEQGQVTCKRCSLGTYRGNQYDGQSQCTDMVAGYDNYFGHEFNVTKCPFGTYSTVTILNDQTLFTCQPCQPGTLCGEGETASISQLFTQTAGYWYNIQDEKSARFSKWPCPTGFYADTSVTTGKTRDEACLPCPQGYYCEGAAIDKQLCLPGYYCPQYTNRSTEYPCPAGTYQPESGQYLASSCTNCPIGYYCPEGSPQPLLCPPGSICPNTKHKTPQDQPCPAGTYQSSSGQTSCITCPQGAYCPTGSAYPQLCPPGTYNDATGKKVVQDCTTCPVNHLCAIFGLTTYEDSLLPLTEAGYLSPLGSKYGQELPCPPGTQDQTFNLTNPEQCTTCPEGFACNPGTALSSFSSFTRKKLKCEPGYFCPAGTLHDKQFPCPGGTYSAADNLVSASQCLTCPAGYFCPPGSSQPYICPNGYFCVAGTENFQHSPCKNGTYSYSKGLKAATECLICPQGYFCKEYSLFPERCPQGTYNNQTGAFIADDSVIDPTNTSLITCKLCTAGYYCPSEGIINQLQCPGGTYSPKGSTQCFPCLEGQDCSSSVGLNNITYKATKCPAGYYCIGNIKQICPKGYFCPLGGRRMQECPVGTYLSSTGGQDLTSCVQAPAGFYTSKVGSSEYLNNLCALGWFCPISSNSQFAYRCPRGTYANQTGQSVCTICPKGYICNETLIHPMICPQGHYCPEGSYEGTKCPIGTFGAALGYVNSSQCQSCLPGQYCSQTGLSSPDGLCDPGYYCKGGARVPNPTDGVTGDVCQKGGFCEYGSKRIKECPPGTFNPNNKGKTQSDCQACTPGSYCSGSNMPSVTGVCKAGYYCPSGSTVETQYTSPPGSYSKANSSYYTLCEAGTYNPFTSQSSCLPCKEGFYCEDEGIEDEIVDCPRGYYCPQGSKTPTKCPVGTYNNQFNAKSVSDCKACLYGKYCASEGLIEPSGDCEQGYYCLTSAISPTPEVESANKYFGPCPAGYYCPVSTSQPLPCPAGTFSSATKAFSIATCTPCTSGMYCSLAALTAPNGNCDPGFYCPPGQKTPRPADYYCQAGQYCPEKSALPITVPAGYYQNMNYQSTYINCPEGYYCTEGSTTYSGKVCPAGYYCPEKTQYSTQYPCQPGYYQPLTGQSSCIQCDPGSYCAQQALTAVSGPCSGGYYCKQGSSIKTPTTTVNGVTIGGLCQKGYYCPEGSAFMIPCTPGKYCDRVGLSQPSGDCLGGYYCKGQATKQSPQDIGNDGGAMCPSGNYCPVGSDVPLPCPVGTYSGNYGNNNLAQCTQCDAGTFCASSGLSSPSGQCAAGFYCPAGSKTPYANQCPKGYRCPRGSSTPIACDSTTQYQDLEANDTCKSCPAGYTCNATSVIGLCGQNFYCPANQRNAIACPAGTFTPMLNASSINDCRSCLPTYYCQSDATYGIVISACPQGVYCSGGAKTSAGNGQCPSGYYCPAQTSNPIACPPGKYCTSTGLSQPQGDCAAEYYCLSGSKTSTPSDNIQGNICPRGYYCPAGTYAPIACPIGTYKSTTGGSTIASCITCPNGFLCNKRAAETYSSKCQAGYYCPDSDTYIECPIGYYCPQNIAAPIKCPAGTYQPNPLQDECLDCPEGFYCPQTPNATEAYICPKGNYCPKKSEQPTACPIGTYNRFKGQDSVSDCSACLEGYYCGSTGLEVPSGLCDAGYFCKSGAISATPIDDSTGNYGRCAKGYYCPEGSSSMIACPVGTYNDNTLSTSLSACLECPSGYYCNKRGQTSTFYGFNTNTNYACGNGLLCTGGAKDQYPSIQSNQAGELCEPGNYCEKGVQYPCPIGTYQPNSGAERCLYCPKGKYCNETGMEIPYDCPPGFYCPDLDSSVLVNQLIIKTPCPAGTYSDFDGNQQASDCIPCKEGMYCLGQGSTSPDGLCTSSYYCPKGSAIRTPNLNQYAMGDEAPGKCPPGYYCPEGAVAPLPCPMGQYNPDSQRDSCLPCPPGRYCDELGLNKQDVELKQCKEGYFCIESATIPNPTDNSTGQMCTPGHYCPLGTTEELECPVGYYEHRWGSSQCQLCYEGYYCPQGSIEPIPCPEGYYCPAFTAEPLVCPDGTIGHAEKLSKSSQCKVCPAGSYCQGGVLVGNCSAGYYCDQGAGAPNEQSKLCPLSHYCPIGTLYPIKCPDGGTTAQRGAKLSTDCRACSIGFYCLKNGDTQYACPRGYYCSGTDEPKACPKYTYNNLIGQGLSTDCLVCPPGYYCNDTAISDFKNYPCPPGYYCPDERTVSPIQCPEGTYNFIGRADNLTDCLTCPRGNYCPLGSIYPKPCRNGTYCPLGSTRPIDCTKGNYCPSESGNVTTCPAAFYCPNTGSDIYIKCKNGTYCGNGSSVETNCPSGFFGSSQPNNTNLATGCLGCDAGFYSENGNNDCKPCTPGYVCLGNTSVSTPTSIQRDGGYICPKGYYCPQQSQEPIPCPRGTFGASTGLKNITECSKCPADTYGDQIGLSQCKKCGGDTKSKEGSTSCSCIGSNRIYLANTQECACKTGFEPAVNNQNEGSQSTSSVDCVEKVYQTCPSGQVQDQLGQCRDANNCSAECNGGSGTIQQGIGICECDNQTTAADICDQSCLAKRKQVTVSQNGQITVTDPETKKSTTITSLPPNVEGEQVKCPQTDTSLCQIVGIQVKSNGDFGADFSLPTAITGRTRRLLQEDQEFITSEKSKRSLATNDSYIANPIVCMTQGSSLIFENLNKNHYPIYLKDSLINTNEDFDYSRFDILAQKLLNGTSSINSFIFTFQDAGIYVFADSNNTAKTTVVAVMGESQKCPSGMIYDSKISTNLLKVGIAVKKDIIYSPDWGFFIGILIGVLCLILLSVFLIGYVYRKSWKTKPYEKIDYQDSQYTMIKIEDPEDTENALISLNADAQAFQFLNAGKEVSRTREQLKLKQQQEKEDRERRRRERKNKQLELEEVEDLKDKLNKHLSEIKKLFGVEDLGGDDSDDDDDLKNQRLMDQIQRLREIIDENRRFLQGEEIDDLTPEQRELQEQEQKEKEEREKKEKEEEDKKIKEQDFIRKQEELQQANEEQLDIKKNEVNFQLVKDMEDRKKEMLEKMQQMGLNLSKEDQDRMLAEFDQNFDKIGALLKQDEDYQSELLRKKLEERKNRRRKLQEKAKELENKIEEKNKEFIEEKQKIEQEYQEEQQQIENDIEKERKEKQEMIKQDLQALKDEKLADYQDRLKDAKNSKEFNQELERFNEANQKVEQELLKQSQKQNDDLEKKLQSIKNARKAQAENKRRQKLNNVNQKLEQEIGEDKKKLEDVKNMLQMDEGSKKADAVEKNIENFRKNNEELNQSFNNAQNNTSLGDKLKKGLLNKLQKLIDQHQLESDEIQNKIVQESKDLDSQVQKAKDEASEEVNQELEKRANLQNKLKAEDLDESQRQALLNDLKNQEQVLQNLMTEGKNKDNDLLQKKLAERKLKKGQLAEEQRQLRQKQLAEKAAEEEIAKAENELALKKASREQLEQAISGMKETLKQDELPYAIQKMLDEKHELELNDLLLKLYEQKCRELQEEIFNLLEEKLNKQGVAQVEAKDKLDLIKKAEDKLLPDDEAMKKKLEDAKEQIKKKLELEMEEIDLAYKQKQMDLEREVAQRLMDKESEKVLRLKEDQMQEKKEILEQHLPQTSVKDILKEMQEDDEKEMDQFKQEQEAEKARKLKELEQMQKLIEQEMERQKERIDRLGHISEEFKKIDQQKEKLNAIQARAQAMKDKLRQDQDFLHKVKQEYERTKSLVHTAYEAERKRQLDLLEANLLKKEQDLQNVLREEEEERRRLEEMERQRLEREKAEKEKAKLLVFEATKKLQDHRKIIFKKRYYGALPPMTEYYTIKMRRKENQQLAKLKNNIENKMLFSLSQTLNKEVMANETSQVTKELQLKKLNEILRKIEILESKVKDQLREQRGLNNYVSGMKDRRSSRQSALSKIKVHDEHTAMSQMGKYTSNVNTGKASQKSLQFERRKTLSKTTDEQQ